MLAFIRKETRNRCNKNETTVVCVNNVGVKHLPSFGFVRRNSRKARHSQSVGPVTEDKMYRAIVNSILAGIFDDKLCSEVERNPAAAQDVLEVMRFHSIESR